MDLKSHRKEFGDDKPARRTLVLPCLLKEYGRRLSKGALGIIGRIKG